MPKLKDPLRSKCWLEEALPTSEKVPVKEALGHSVLTVVQKVETNRTDDAGENHRPERLDHPFFHGVHLPGILLSYPAG